MRKVLTMGLMFLFSNLLKGPILNPLSSVRLTKTKAMMLYLQSIKALRLLFISLLGMGTCLVFLLAGILLFHAGIFLYAPWPAEAKMTVTFICAAIYVAAAAGLCWGVLKQDQWVRMFNAEDIVSALSSLNGSKEDV